MSQDQSGGDIPGAGAFRWPRATVLGLTLALGACASAMPPEPMPESLTMLRITGRPVDVPPLMPVPGNVWPERELLREALTMGDRDLLESAPVDNPPPPRRPIPRGSSTPPGLLDQQGRSSVPEVRPVPEEPRTPPYPPARPTPEWERRSDGQVIPTPQGPAVTTGGGPGYRTYNIPGVGSGVAIPNGATTTLLGQDGSVQQVPTPR